MDPNATLKMINEFLEDRRTGDEVDDWCGNLFEWIQKGGFEPEWNTYPIGTSYYWCYVAQRKKEAVK